MSEPAPARIAMWSGPRNISTAMMRSWGSRPDCAVSDEPLYGHYLAWLPPHRRAEHPAAEEVIAAMDCDWRSVTATLAGPVPGGRPIWYQKHMAHHLTPGMDLGWVERLTNCFLVRDPAAMITSFIRVIPNPTPDDLGLPQQVALFERIRDATGRTPPVVDSADVLRDPRGTLSALCSGLGVAFDEAMLSWTPGPRPEDGVWAPHWYTGVYESKGFAPYTPKTEPVPGRLAGVLAACEGFYATLAAHRVRAR
jgi:hypothetical protein